MLKSVVKSLSGLLILILIVDPGDLIFHLKTPLFLLIFLFWFLFKSSMPIKINRDIIFISMILLIIPILGIIFAIIQNTFSDPTFAFGVVKSFLVILLLLVVVDCNIPVDVYLNKLSLIIPLIIIPIYIFISISPSLFVALSAYLASKDAVKFSNRSFYGYDVIMLYYRTSPLLIFPLAHYSNQFFNGNQKLRNFLLSILFLFTLILSGTRANMLCGVAIVTYILFEFLIRRNNKLPFFIGCLTLVIVAISFFKTLSFSDNDQSSDIKSGHLDSYMRLFREHPQYLIWGSGLGSTFYTSGTNAFASQTELTYLDLIRWFGIPMTLVLLFLLLYPIIYISVNYKRIANVKHLVVAYLGYLFIVGTNPLLLSSTGMLAVITMYSLLPTRRSMFIANNQKISTEQSHANLNVFNK